MVECIYKLYVQRRGRNGKHESSEFSRRCDVLPENKRGACGSKNFCVRCPECGTSKNCQRDCGSEEFVSSDLQNAQYQVAFEDLKKEILVGHQEIAQGKVTSVADVRKEFGLD